MNGGECKSEWLRNICYSFVYPYLLYGTEIVWYLSTLCSEKKHPLLFCCITLRKSNQFE